MTAIGPVEPRTLIGVIGGQAANEDAARLAYEVGREIGARGLLLVCGGRDGVMREACRGARDAGGLTLAILPGDDLSDANEFIDIPIVTGLGFARNTIIARTCNALIAVHGSYGTLSEIAFALIAGTPVVALGSWTLADGSGGVPPIERATTPAEAVARAVARARPHRR
jgi:hypothetical protein